MDLLACELYNWITNINGFSDNIIMKNSLRRFRPFIWCIHMKLIFVLVAVKMEDDLNILTNGRQSQILSKFPTLS